MKNLFDDLLIFSLLHIYNSWYFESLLNYHTTIVYFGAGKNFLCVIIFILHNFQLLFNK